MLSVWLTIGLYNRAILCPPFLSQTYPQFKTIELTKKYFRSFDYAVIFIFQNDGTKSWKINKDNLCHINFKKKVGKQLKGTEAGQSREVAMITRKYQGFLKKEKYETFGMTCGHCDLCGHKCENRDRPPCKHKGMPSLEACFIDVYQLLNDLDVNYDYPVMNTLTAVSSILVKK